MMDEVAYEAEWPRGPFLPLIPSLELLRRSRSLHRPVFRGKKVVEIHVRSERLKRRFGEKP